MQILLISYPLHIIIINQCFQEGCFPKQLKESKVIPVGSKTDIKKYTPITITPFLSKILEKAIT